MARNRTHRLEVENFAHIHRVDVTFGDLTVLVGPQASGKSLVLQWLKLVLDGGHVLRVIREAGYRPESPEDIVELVFGTGMAGALRTGESPTTIRFDERGVSLTSLSRRGSRDSEQVFYIPAHRALLIADGWAAPFQRLSVEYPFVARWFSQHLYQDLGRGSKGATLFPRPGKLKEAYRKAIDEAVYHGGEVVVHRQGLRARLALRYRTESGDILLSFPSWTAGQREFTPLLLGLYALLPASKLSKDPHIEWVIIEEPEMGLHPRGVAAVFLLILDLMWRGYRVVLSTHSQDVVSAVWMLQELRRAVADWDLVAEAFKTNKTKAFREVAERALEADYRAYALSFRKDGRIRSHEISSLNPWSEAELTASWGSLTELSARFEEIVIDAMEAKAVRS